MTEDRPYSVARALGNRHDYLPAAGCDALLPGYDPLTRTEHRMRAERQTTARLTRDTWVRDAWLKGGGASGSRLLSFVKSFGPSCRRAGFRRTNFGPSFEVTADELCFQRSIERVHRGAGRRGGSVR